jgi:hypothetical protein
MTELAANEPTHVIRPPHLLVPLIKEDLRNAQEASERASMPYKIAAGEKMNEAKGQMAHGEFTGWIRRNFKMGMSQAQYYMQMAATTIGKQKHAAVEFDSVKDFRRRHLGHDLPTSGGGLRQPAWRDDVKETVQRAREEARRVDAERLSRQQERDAERKLALRLIDIGFKVLSKELHPDKGGSRDVMARLNRVRARLKESA